MPYEAVMQLAHDRPELLPLVKAAHDIVVKFGNHFSGSSVLTAAPGLAANLRPLSSRGIIVKTNGSKQGHRAFYRLVDLAGVETALRELGLV